MLLGLSKLIGNPGGQVPFTTSLDLSDLQFGTNCPATEPVVCEGIVRNTAGVLLLTGALRTTLHGACDRCTVEFSRDVEYSVEAVLVTSLENEDSEDEWTFLLDGDCADLDDIMTTAFVFSMEPKFLCQEDCKGLCMTCGTNLNHGECQCKPEIDPRFAALQQLLKK
ncbi:MAG: DUF177 domain-containing protein [Eubacteriales bacterium]